jgi:methylmalonyl-CoA mutase N-terminal domain/subunit
VTKLKVRRAGRDEEKVKGALKEIAKCAATRANLILPLLVAARAEATLGEICGVLRSQWPAWREPSRF